jgi:diacylglycerol kinase (ATP)
MKNSLTHIHFIINPIAGSGNNQLNTSILNNYFDDQFYKAVVKQSLYKKHAIKLTQESINEGAAIIVACGGDGTINEVASCLVKTPIVLGIIPIGSGNGLASNLKIPKNTLKAISLIKKQTVEKIDVGQINENYFFSNSGIGFDAEVVKNYEANDNRKLFSYLIATIKSLRKFNGMNEIEVTINNKTIITKPFMIFISNSNELGYNISLTPKASLQDGLLDVLVIPKLNLLKMFFLGVFTLLKKAHLLKEVFDIQTNRIKLLQNKIPVFNVQIDGESHTIHDNMITISILEKSLNVIV